MNMVYIQGSKRRFPVLAGVRTLGFLLLFPIHFLFPPEIQAYPAEDYLSVDARSGDGVYALLRRYGLDGFGCNLEKFFDLNSLGSKNHLIAGNSYRLPILLYTYNGRSIRSTIGVNEWEHALRIQHYNEDMVKAGLREKPFQEDLRLWVPWHELYCPTEGKAETVSLKGGEQPETPVTAGDRKERTFPIFGPEYAYTPLAGKSLEGRVYYIVSGHGGPDPGAIGRWQGKSLCEDEYAYDVALRVCRHLIAHGATAYMITRDYDDGIRSDKYLPCDYDEVLWGNVEMVRPMKARLFQRSDVINGLYEKHLREGNPQQELVIIHVDSRQKAERIDLFFYYRENDDASRDLASNMHNTMREKYGIHRANGAYHGSVSPRDLHMLRETKPTPVYIELGNIRNGLDQTRIILESNRKALADWIFEGLAR